MERGPSISPKELAHELGVSLSTAYHLVHSLVQTGFVISEPYRGLRPGPVLYRLLELLGQGRPRAEAFEPLVDEVGRSLGCRAYLAVWSDRDVEVVYVHGRRGVRELPGLGRGFRGAAHALAIGKVLLANRLREDWPPYLQADHFPARTPFTLTELPALSRELGIVQEQGVAFDREEFALGSCCIAVPLDTVAGRPAELTLGISVPARRFTAEQTLLTSVLCQISRRREFGT